MTITFVTAFYAPSTPYRTTDVYFSKFETLAESGITILLFLDNTLHEQGQKIRDEYTNVVVEYIDPVPNWAENGDIYEDSESDSVDKKILSFYHQIFSKGGELVLPAKRNQSKDTLHYFYIQLSKLFHMSTASRMVDSTHLAWIDFGIFHMFSDAQRFQDLLRHISSLQFPKMEKVLSPGCWRYKYPKIFVNDVTLWYHCGSFMIGESHLFPDLYKEQTAAVIEQLPMMTWEVNYWTMMEGFTSYPADHNETILTNLIAYIYDIHNIHNINNLNGSGNTNMSTLEQLADHSRTDKNTIHSYMPIYQKLFESKQHTAKHVVEIGIGISPKGGGSVKLWHDYFPNAHVYAMDIQSIDLFWDEIKNKERITLFTDTDAYNDVFVDTHFLQDRKLDIIIDDGAHTLDSMIKFISLYSQALADGGVMVIEDLQDIEWVNVLRRYVPIHLKPYIEVYDLRSIKGRYDDIMFVINANKTI